MSGSLNKGHVCFGFDERFPKDNSLIVNEISPGHVQVHLGFLQLNYSYSMTVEIPKSYFLGSDVDSILKAAEKSPPNVNCRVISIRDKETVIEIVLEFHAQKERLLKEELKFSLEKDLKVVVEFNARVLGPGKGTPLLKNGIRCIGIPADDMSELSDCQL